MGTFIGTLSAEQRNNVNGLIESMKRNGISNTMMQAGILAVISKESSFVPKSENDYSKTENDRIRAIFGSRLKQLSDAELTALKKDPKAFFDLIYGGRYENAADEGYKYRGRGFNQLTFKSNYIKTANRIGVDLVQFPDKLNEVPVATEAVISFFKEKFAAAPKAKLALYGMTDINSAKSIDAAAKSAYHANTGWGKTSEQIVNETTGGYKKALARVAEFFEVTSGVISLSGSKPSRVISEVSALSARVLFRVSVKASTLNVRVQPDAKSAKTTERNPALAGEVLSVYEEKNGWYRISATKQQWVAAAYCKPA